MLQTDDGLFDLTACGTLSARLTAALNPPPSEMGLRRIKIAAGILDDIRSAEDRLAGLCCDCAAQRGDTTY